VAFRRVRSIKRKEYCRVNHEKFISDILKGITPESRKRMSESAKKSYLDPIKALNHSKFWKQSKQEKFLEQILITLNFPFKFCGSGAESVWISGMCPDFIRTDGIKQIIEFAGAEVWKGPQKMIDKEIKWNSIGYQVLILRIVDIYDFNTLITKLYHFCKVYPSIKLDDGGNL
jgi:hypothetical protein